MKKKVLFWIDQSLIHFGIAKFLHEHFDCDMFSIFEITEKPKKFFQNQNIVNFQKIWFLHDYLLNNDTLDIEYLRLIEKKYAINLHLIALNDRLFNELNTYHHFSHDEILLILQNEIKLFEKILDEINPDFIIMPVSHQQHNHIFYKICKSRKIKILMVVDSRIGIDANKKGHVTRRYFIGDDLDPYASLPVETTNSNSNTDTIFEKDYDYHFLSSNKKYLKAASKFFITSDKNVNTHYSYLGRQKIKVIFKTFAYELRKKYRSNFMNKNLATKISQDGKKYAYFPLHQEMERALLIGAPFYINQFNHIKHIANSLPVGYKLIVKDHPEMAVRGWRSVDEMKQIMKFPNVILLHPFSNSDEIINQCDLVLSIKGSTGIEAALMKKPSIIFGEVGMYKLSNMILVTSMLELPKIIEQALTQKISEDEIELYKKSVYENSFDFPYYELTTGLEEQFKEGGYYTNVEISQDKMSHFFDKHNEEFSYLIQKFIQKMESN